jgi:D-tagatose-1,6-bisphosphate aldolase subunit GatZ/KbaZ
MTSLKQIIQANKEAQKQGVYSVCCAHPMVLKAAITNSIRYNSLLLVEATANQVNQFGGYTGMQPADFIDFVRTLAKEQGLPAERLVFGGDHLGPVCWTDKPAEEAMALAKTLIEEYVKAGFTKIHLDTSMPCADDPEVLPDEVIAKRAASLCKVAESHSEARGRVLDYVIGTEVPAPGGVSELEQELKPTPVENVRYTLDCHRQAFAAEGLGESTWDKVLAIVVQPGVEFDNARVHDFTPGNAQALSVFIKQEAGLVYEAHSTDYQHESALSALVQGHFAILKVGPQLTFALREALFALSHIEEALIAPQQYSGLRRECEQLMQQQPNAWQKFYPPGAQNSWMQFFSFSDRIRYYWNQPALLQAVENMLNNLRGRQIPQPLLSQYLPEQYRAVREGALSTEPEALIEDKIIRALDSYARACNSGTVIAA